MRKIVLNLAVSLDGFIEDAQGRYDWCFTDQDYGMTEFLKNTDAIFIGRKSYQVMEKEEANFFGNKKLYLFSNSITKPALKNTQVISGNWIDNVQELKSAAGKNIWMFGGANLIASFMKEKLIDELMLSIHPVLLGGGKPLVQHLDNRIQLKLTGTTRFDTGLVQLFYNVLP